MVVARQVCCVPPPPHEGRAPKRTAQRIRLRGFSTLPPRAIVQARSAIPPDRMAHAADHTVPETHRRWGAGGVFAATLGAPVSGVGASRAPGATPALRTHPGPRRRSRSLARVRRHAWRAAWRAPAAGCLRRLLFSTRGHGPPGGATGSFLVDAHGAQIG